jgi:periplasmic mercuric ion binding protein
MKAIKFIVTAIIAFITCTLTYSQSHNHSQMASTRTESIKIGGNCELCKTRIEKAAKIEGVNKVDWNIDTKVLTLVYNSSLTTVDKIQQSIAAVGHDTEKFRATDAVYKNLPSCCHYERKK